MPDPKFQRRIEDFTCGHCGAEVKGNGYTNHCPKCLWSKHVDIHPGDRAATCGGMMEPVSVEGSTGSGYKLRHKCVICHHERINGVVQADDPDAVVALAKNAKRV